ncbi:MAG: MBL fold metallo-hydrolase [Chloroflexi bacterium]|nr:MBL fold metallo-hydrolase [Chloroflexota bacterium]
MTTSLTIGDYEVTAVLDSPGPPRDPSTVFPTVPAKDWDPYRSFALDSEGMWLPDWCSHIIRAASGEGPVILVDSGMGDVVHQHTGKKGQLLNNLAALGIQPEDVDIVVTTHCHGDHIGWNVAYGEGNGTPALTFPSATHWIAARDWGHYTKPENSNPAFDKSVKPLKQLGALKLVEGVEQLAPGITTLPTNGHTPGHQCVLIESGGDTGVLTGDLFHNVVQVTEQTWCPTFDWNTDMSTESRQRLLNRAMNERWTVFTGHLPTGTSIGNIVSEAGKTVWKAL